MFFLFFRRKGFQVLSLLYLSPIWQPSTPQASRFFFKLITQTIFWPSKPSFTYAATCILVSIIKLIFLENISKRYFEGSVLAPKPYQGTQCPNCCTNIFSSNPYPSSPTISSFPCSVICLRKEVESHRSTTLLTPGLLLTQHMLALEGRIRYIKE